MELQTEHQQWNLSKGRTCKLTNAPCTGTHYCTQCNIPLIKKLEELRPG